MTLPLLIGSAKGWRDTRDVIFDSGVLNTTGMTLEENFGSKKAIVIGDVNTMNVAGDVIVESLPGCETFIFEDPDLYAEHRFVERLEAALRKTDATPVAVGSGTINDLTKLASHRTGRQYLCVPTAASMDGYTAYGASITYRGSKQTFDCPAPRAVLVETGVLAEAPLVMTASGYADLLAKLTAGADWIVADALGVEAIDVPAWGIVQAPLRRALADPKGARGGKWEAIQLLTQGLLISGFAMQAAQSSRPASGAEHQFSHLWDMQHHTHNGQAPSHGFKVGVATVAVARFYEELLRLPLQELDVDVVCAAWPARETMEASIRELFAEPETRDVGMRESLAKYISGDALRAQLKRLRDAWPEMVTRLRAQLLPSRDLVEMLSAVGAPSEPEQIGISRDRLRRSFHLAVHIRRRFTVLDLAARAGVTDQILDRMFNARSV